MTQQVLIQRSITTALTPGVSTLSYGQLAFTFISGVKRFYIGDSSNLAQEIAGDAYALLASPALTGTPTAPTASSGTNTTQIATTAFVTAATTAAAAGINNKGNVTAATTAGLPSYTYSNGTSGVGATITASANGALASQDGITLIVNDILLVKNETAGNAPYNGAYKVTQVGSAGTPFILTRATNFNSTANIQPNSTFTITQGTTLADQLWWIAGVDSAVTVGTTNLVFTAFNSGTVTAGNGISVSSGTISVVSDSTGGSNLSRSVNVSTNGLAIKIDGNSITEGASNRLAVKKDITTGATIAPVSITANGVGIEVDNSSIIHTSGVLSVSVIDGGTF